MATKLPMLDDIKVASPCTARWEEMIGDARVRYCTHCEKNVFNLSAMTRDEAQALVEEKQGEMCARFYRRADGTMLTADCPVGVRRKRVRRIAALAAGAGALSALATGMAMREPATQPCTMGDISPVATHNPPQPEPRPMMGAIAVPAPEATTPPVQGKVAQPTMGRVKSR